MRAFRFLCLPILAVALLGPRPSAAAPAAKPPASTRTVRIHVRSHLDADDDQVKAAVLEKVTVTLEKSGYTITTENTGVFVALSIAWAEQSGTDYRVEIGVSPDPSEGVEQVDAFTCEDCDAQRLLETTSKRVVAALKALENTRPESPKTTATPAPKPSSEPHRKTPSTTYNTLPGLRPVGVAGIGLASSGVVFALAGAVLWGVGEVTTESSGFTIETRDLRPAGIGLTAGGLGLVAAGVTMAAVDGQRRRKSLPKLLGRLGWAGVGLIATGGTAALVGAGLSRDYRSTGIALGSVGIALAVSGVAMAGVDATRRRRASISVTPSIGPTMTGVALGGVF